MSLLEMVELLLDSCCCCCCWVVEAGLGCLKGSKSGSMLWLVEAEPSLVVFFLGRKAFHHGDLSVVMAGGEAGGPEGGGGWGVGELQSVGDGQLLFAHTNFSLSTLI